MPVTQADNLAQLLEFEAQFENAIYTVLNSAGVPAFIDQMKVKLPLANVAVGFDVGGAIDELTELEKPDYWPADQAAPQEYFRYTGAFDVRVEVPLDQNTATVANLDSLLGQFRGLVRASFLRTAMPFDEDNLPFYRVSDIRPGGTVSGVDRTRNIYFCSLRFSVWFAIQPEAWPAWPTTP